MGNHLAIACRVSLCDCEAFYGMLVSWPTYFSGRRVMGGGSAAFLITRYPRSSFPLRWSKRRRQYYFARRDAPAPTPRAHAYAYARARYAHPSSPITYLAVPALGGELAVLVRLRQRAPGALGAFSETVLSTHEQGLTNWLAFSTIRTWERNRNAPRQSRTFA